MIFFRSGAFPFLYLIRYRDPDLRSALFAEADRHGPAAHHLKSLPDILQGDVRPVIILGVIAGAVVLHKKLAPGIRLPGLNADVQRRAVRIPAVLDAVFHDGLQGQRRNTKRKMRRVVFHRDALLKLRLLDREIGAGMLQLLRKRDRRFTCNGCEVFAQVGGEIHRDLPGFLRVLITEVIDAGHGVVDEVRPHLQHHDAGTLMGNLPLLAQVLLDLALQDNDVHRNCRNTDADVYEQIDRDKQMDEQGGRKRNQRGEQRIIDFFWHPVPSADYAFQIQKHDHNQGHNQQRVQGAALIQALRCIIVKPVCGQGGIQQNEKDAPDSCHDAEKLALSPLFPAVMQQEDGRHGQQN